MSYATDDFTESLNRVPVPVADIAAVEAAWGHGEGMGDDAGHFKWSEDGASEWSGGFLMRLKDGSYVYVTGWCGYTGWGCQDGAEVHRFAERPTLEVLIGIEDSSAPPAEEWDIDPADLNRWLSTAVSVEP